MREYCPLLHLCVVAIEKGAFRSPSTTVTNFNFIYILLQWNFYHRILQSYIQTIFHN